jgi:hypothetical protein
MSAGHVIYDREAIEAAAVVIAGPTESAAELHCQSIRDTTVLYDLQTFASHGILDLVN